MRFQSTKPLAFFALCLSICRAIPLAEPNPISTPTVDGPQLEDREPHAMPDPNGRGANSKPSNCPSQKPISQNLCTSGSPYCCSGQGAAQVCGPSSSTTCTATTICCINTNGVRRLPWQCKTWITWYWRESLLRCRYVLERLTSLGRWLSTSTCDDATKGAKEMMVWDGEIFQVVLYEIKNNNIVALILRFYTHR
jgi:hypothetical protein